MSAPAFSTASSPGELLIEIAPRRVWQPLLDEALGDAPAPVRDLSAAVLERLHDRHVGISITLAVQFARLLAPGSRPPPLAGWGNVLRRLQHELESGHGAAIGLLLDAAPPYAAFRLALPVVQEACRRLGRSVLLAEDNQASLDAGAYRRYAADLLRSLSRIADDRDDPSLALFWRERATGLASLSARAGADPRRHLPRSDALQRACFFRLRDPVDPPSRTAVKLRPRQASDQRRGVAMQEGVAGIRVAHGLDQVHSMLFSEYMNPPALLADRIANTGYLAIRRHARRESLRHVLLVGLLPPGLAGTAAGAFVKAAWFHFAARAAWLLARSRLLRSDIVWIEGDALARVRRVERPLSALPPLPAHTACDDRFVRTFTHALHWMPDFLDQRGGEPSGVPADLAAQAGGLALWLRAAWDRFAASRREAELDAYGVVLTHLLLPGDSTEPASPGFAAARLAHDLAAQLGHTNRPGHCLCATRVPARVDDLAAWDIGSHNDPRPVRERPALGGDAASAVNNWLQEHWTLVLRRELNGE